MNQNSFTYFDLFRARRRDLKSISAIVLVISISIPSFYIQIHRTSTHSGTLEVSEKVEGWVGVVNHAR